MSKVECRYNDSIDHRTECVYLDTYFSDDRFGGNYNELVFALENICGNYIKTEMVTTDGDTYSIDVDKIKLKIRGGVEADQFLNALKLIIETDTLVSIIKP